jgi:hypothetical protein
MLKPSIGRLDVALVLGNLGVMSSHEAFGPCENAGFILTREAALFDDQAARKAVSRCSTHSVLNASSQERRTYSAPGEA